MRETKLAEICGRRLGDCNLADLPYEKLIEVKLII